MTAPLVSVVIPAYNCEKLIASALDSVLSETYAPFEVIVVDDGSTDGTVRILESYGDRIRLFRKTNGGPAAARNLAVSKARGEYLAFLDGDDLWLPGHLTVLMDYLLAHPDTRIVYGDWRDSYPDASGRYTDTEPTPADMLDGVDEDWSGSVYTKLLFDSIIHIIASVIHRSVYDKVNGFDETLRTGSDWDFWIRASQHFHAVKLKRRVAVYRQNPVSVTHTVRMENNPYRVLNGAIQRYGIRDDLGRQANRSALDRKLSDLAFDHAYKHFWRGNALTAATWFSRSFRHQPTRWRAAGYVLAALAKSLGQMPARR